jgi:hypothetical protein
VFVVKEWEVLCEGSSMVGWRGVRWGIGLLLRNGEREQYERTNNANDANFTDLGEST